MCKMPIFKERLNHLLVESGKTVVAFAEFLGTSRQSLGYYLNGERIPDAKMIHQICERCHVSADWLLGLSDVKTPDTDIQAVCRFTGLSEKAIRFLINKKDQDSMEIPDFQDGFTKDIMDFSDILSSLLESDPDKLNIVFHGIFDTWLIDRNQNNLSNIGGLQLVEDTSSLVLSANQALDFKLYDTCQKFRELLSDVFNQLDSHTIKGV